MRRIAAAVAVLALSGCSFAPPPRCCPAEDPPVRQRESLRTRAAGFQQVADDKLEPHWPFGILLSIYFSDRTMHEVTAFDDPPDAALYTGIYAAAQAFRYASTSGEEKAATLKAVRKAANALHTLAAVPGYPGGLARAASKDPCTIQCSPTTQYCYRNADRVWWLGNTSRDQYTGWWFGNAIVYRLVDDPQIRATIREDVGQMIGAIRKWNYRLHDQNGQPNSGTAGAVHHQMRITWHLIAATILPEQPYLQWYQEQVTALDLDEAWLEDAFDVTNVYYDYYSFNLGFLNAYNMVMLEADPRLHARFLGWMERELYRYVRNTGNALFDFMQMAAGGSRSEEVIEADKESLARFPRTARLVGVRLAAAAAIQRRFEAAVSREPVPLPAPPRKNVYLSAGREGVSDRPALPARIPVGRVAVQGNLLLRVRERQRRLCGQHVRSGVLLVAAAGAGAFDVSGLYRRGLPGRLLARPASRPPCARRLRRRAAAGGP